MKKTKQQKTCLKIGIFFILVALGCGLGIADIIYDSYSYDITITDGESIELFGPKKFDLKVWEHQDRFKYRSWKKTINC